METRGRVDLEAAGLQRVAEAYGSLVSCAADLDELRDRFDKVQTIYSTPEACGRAVWISVIDAQQRAVLGTMLAIRRFVASTSSSVALLLADVRRDSGTAGPRDPPLLVLLSDGRRVLFSAGKARDDLLAARECVRRIISDEAGAHRRRLTAPYKALDAGARALDRLARVLAASLPRLAALGLAARPLALEAFG